MSAPKMVLPDLSDSGEHWCLSLGDDRIPTPLGGTDGSVYRLGRYGTGECPDGRHLFDVIQSARDVEEERPDGEWTHHEQFRACLTCVTCGYVEAWRGTRQPAASKQLDVTPIKAGGLVAQETRRYSGWGAAHGESWSIHDAATGERLGSMGWRRAPRGRVFHEARLDAWPVGVTVEGPTPESALRKAAARLHQPAR